MAKPRQYFIPEDKEFINLSKYAYDKWESNKTPFRGLHGSEKGFKYGIPYYSSIIDLNGIDSRLCFYATGNVGIVFFTNANRTEILYNYDYNEALGVTVAPRCYTDASHAFNSARWLLNFIEGTYEQK